LRLFVGPDQDRPRGIIPCDTKEGARGIGGIGVKLRRAKQNRQRRKLFAHRPQGHHC